jgi:anti-sigma-K factor RskA
MNRWFGVEKRRPHDPERNAAEYVSGELPRRVSRWFESHLLECEDCWREVLFGRLGQRLAEHSREQAPAALRDRIRANIQMTGASGEQEP